MKTLKLIPVVAAALLLSASMSHAAEQAAAKTQVQPGQAQGSASPHDGGFMKRIDKNGDGKISKDEFIAVQTERFTKMDKNGDGFLSRDEMRSAREMVRPQMHRHGGPNQGKNTTTDDDAGGVNE